MKQSTDRQRKNASAREKDLRLALHRIVRGRASTKVTKVSIVAVAREAGVSPALIHNHYPSIADAIRVAQGRSSRLQRDAKHQQLKAQQQRARELREEIVRLRADVAKLASINEVLLAEAVVLNARLKSPHIIQLNGKL